MPDGAQEHEVHRVAHPEGHEEGPLPGEPGPSHQRAVLEVLLRLLLGKPPTQEPLDVRQSLEPLSAAPEALQSGPASHPHFTGLERNESHDTEGRGAVGVWGRAGAECSTQRLGPAMGSDQ